MEVILIEDVTHLGKIGSLVKVASGYGRNFLLPQRLAIAASTKNRRRLEHEKRLAGYRLQKVRKNAETIAEKLTGLSVTIARKVGDQDKLYGSVTSQDVHKALAAEGVELDRRKIEIDEPIKSLGVYDIPVRLQADVHATVKVWVVAE